MNGSLLYRCLAISAGLLLLVTNIPSSVASTRTLSDILISEQQAHPGLSGGHILEQGEDALYARAWLADHAEKTIDVQYFIWSTDNIGILASESLLRAAERGVKVRVIVDDLLIDASSRSLVALAKHPNVSIKIYNPKHKVGTTIIKRVWNVLTNFRGINQRMHNKTFIVDNKVAITGGRNMADEYFDYDKEYNFRDRDILVAGPVVSNMGKSFQQFWESDLSVTVEKLLRTTSSWMTDDEAEAVYSDLHKYAANPDNFDEQARETILNIPERFDEVLAEAEWTNIHFLADEPGKNGKVFSLGGGGKITSSLADLARTAEKQITIQTPYLVLSSDAFTLFEELLQRGVKIRISTNSLTASDNLPAFSGYSRQRQELLDMGVEVYEYRPYPVIRKKIMQRFSKVKDYKPVFALHAKTMVVDSHALFIGTYNLDPRSENLNTEVGILLFNDKLAGRVEKNIEVDMMHGNSWNARLENGDDDAGLLKRTKSIFWQMLPLDPIL